MRNLIFIVLVFCSIKDIAQNKTIDSLKNILTQPSIEDTIKLNVASEIGLISRNFNVSFWDSLAAEAELIGHDPVISSCYNNLGYIYQNKGNVTKALESYSRSLEISKKHNNKVGIAQCLNNLGMLYKQQGDLSEALTSFQSSLVLLEEIKDKRAMTYLINNIAGIHLRMGDTSLVMTNYLKCLSIQTELNDLVGMRSSINNIGSAYYNTGEYDSALVYFEQALALGIQTSDSMGISTAYFNLAHLYFDLAQLEKAYQTAMNGLIIAQESNYPHNVSSLSNLLHKILKKQALNQQSINSQKTLYKKALAMYELHIQMRDSIKNKQTQKATIRQQTKYEFERAQLIAEQKRNEELRVMNAELQRRDNLQYSIILVAILAVFGLVLSLGFVSVSPKVAEGLIFFAFLILFEFLLVLTDPYVDGLTDGEPMYKLLLNAVLAGLIFPAHSFFETTLKKKLISKTNQ